MPRKLPATLKVPPARIAPDGAQRATMNRTPSALERLDMRERTYGWNLEMQMRAARAGLRILELPVCHRRRA